MAPPPEATPRTGRSRSRADLWLVAAATVGCFFVASTFELHEALSRQLARLERWQADEIPLTLMVLAFGLAWYALRRRGEALMELALRTQAERRVADLLAHNRELARKLLLAHESERLALARELHDELGQSCTAIRIETACLRHCADHDRPAMLAAAERADAAASELYGLVRDLLSRLRPANLDALGLAAAVQGLCEAWSDRTGIACRFRAEGETDSISDEIDISLYRVAQEALTNVARHADAGKVAVSLSRPAPDELRLDVEDDGKGMDLDTATRGLGLLGAQERAASIGGTLDIRSAPGRGLTIALRVPLGAAP